MNPPSFLRSWQERRGERQEKEEALARDSDRWRTRRQGLTWKVYVVERALWLEDELTLAEQEPEAQKPEGHEVVKSCRKLLADARRSVKGETLRNIWNWFTGYDIERAWSALHAAQAQLILIQSEKTVRAQIPEIQAALPRLEKNDPRRRAYEPMLKDVRAGKLSIDVDLRHELRQAMETTFREADAVFGRIRGFRNVLLGTILFLVVALALIAAYSSSDWLPVCAPATASSAAGQGSCPEVWQIYLVGGLGGLLAAVVAMRRLEGLRGPYGLPLVQAALKIPTGVLTGLVGAIFIQSSVIGLLEPQAGNRILAYVALLGYAQEAFTRAVDNRAAEILAPPTAEGDESSGKRQR